MTPYGTPTVAGLRYTELDPGNKVDKIGGGGAWEDWDMSAIIPAGAAIAELSMEHNANGPMGIRANGSAVGRTTGGAGGTTPWAMTIQVALDFNRIIEVYNPASGIATYKIWGYWA